MRLSLGKWYQIMGIGGWGKPFYVKALATDAMAYGIEYKSGFYSTLYEKTLVQKRWREVTEFETEFEGEENMSTLYQIDESRYGTKLATNSKGMWVMEVKGTGDVITVDPKTVEEVIPYSVRIQFFGNGFNSYDYWCEKDKLNIGDLVLVTNSPHGPQFASVVGVDVKSKKANKNLECKRVVLEEV